MRVLLTADPELPVPPKLYGGIERIVDALVTELSAIGFEVGLVAHRESSAAAKRIYAWPGLKSKPKIDIFRNSAALWRAVRDFKPDVLHSFSRALYMLPLLTNELPKIMSYQRRPGLRQVAWTSRFGGDTISFTGCSEHICEHGRRGGGRWHAIHNFIDPRKFTYSPSVPSDGPLVFLSRVEQLKGAHIAIEVAKRSGRRLIIAGNHGESGNDGRYWREEIQPRLADGAVEYIGPVDDARKNELLGKAAAMIVPVQWDEPFGIVFAESLACGTPVISCPRGALPEIVRHGTEGFLVRDVNEAVGAVTRLGEISRAACRHRAEQAFSVQVIAARYANLYHEIAAVPGR